MNEVVLSISRRKLINLGVIVFMLLAACSGLTGGGGEQTGDSPDVPPTEAPMVLTGRGGGSIIYIPGGVFVMGSDENEPGSESDEQPKHRVNVSGFWIQQTEVTNDQYAQCVAEGECALPAIQNDPEQETHYDDPAYANHPVEGVTWFQANGYCDYLGGRLPTEAEWEKTARGLMAYTYPWGADDPDCDLTNQEGCNSPETTDPIGTRDKGLSPYEAFDMAGNVGEWTYDWYTPSYAEAAQANPYGPQLGELKVWRGGGYGESGHDLRTANRNALDPSDYLPGLGFRCVLSAQEEIAYAPFCQPTYTAFCNPGGGMDGGLDRPDRPEIGEEPDPRVTGFGCPQRGIVEVSVDLGLPSADGYTMTVNGQTYTDCFTLPEFPGRLYCKGPAAPQGAIVEVTVCQTGETQGGSPNPSLVAYQPAAGEPGGLIAYQPASNSLVAFNAFQQQTAPGNTDDYCPQGYTYNPLTGECAYDETQTGCPDGWTWNANLYRCEPGPDGGGCPEGSAYDPELQRCVTDGDDCGEGFYLTHLPGLDQRSCEPETHDDGGGLCPLGYFYDRSINCCSPIPETGNGCEQGTYYDQLRGLCLPLDGNGCPAGTAYDPFKGCVPGGPLGENPPYGECPEGTTLNPDNNTCEPNNPQTFATAYVPGTVCPGGYELNDLGQCMPTEGEPQDCGPNAYYDPRFEQCVETEDGCGLGFYYDARSQTCEPHGGPGSRCGYGYVFDNAANCCVPVPGSDGTACPGEDELNGNTPLVETWYAAAPSLFDYGALVCDPGEDGCPQGYRYSPDQNTCVPIITEEGCPEGTTYDPERQTCTPDVTGECPEGYAYLTAMNACEPEDGQLPECSEGYYFNPQVGYCLPTDDEGCGVGYLAAGPEVCEPQGDDPNGECPTGYYYDTRQNTCLPLGEGGGCWTVRVSVPVCAQPTVTPDPRCPSPAQRWDEATQKCEGIDGPTPTPEPKDRSCSDYSNETSCDNAGCYWVQSTTSYCTNIVP